MIINKMSLEQIKIASLKTPQLETRIRIKYCRQMKFPPPQTQLSRYFFVDYKKSK